MRKTILFICSILLFLSADSFAQKPKSTIRFQFDDGSLMKIAVNNRHYPNISSSIIIGDIPGKRPFVQIYRFRPYADGKGGKAELIFSKRLKIERGQEYEAVVNSRNRTVDLMKVNRSQQNSNALGTNNNTPIQNSSSGLQQESSFRDELSPELQTVLRAMDDEVSDMKKIEVVKNYIGNEISFEETKMIAASFLFDDTRLEFVKFVYPKVTDKSQFKTLETVFSSEAGRKSFQEFIDKIQKK